MSFYEGFASHKEAAKAASAAFITTLPLSTWHGMSMTVGLDFCNAWTNPKMPLSVRKRVVKGFKDYLKSGMCVLEKVEDGKEEEVTEEFASFAAVGVMREWLRAYRHAEEAATAEVDKYLAKHGGGATIH